MNARQEPGPPTARSEPSAGGNGANLLAEIKKELSHDAECPRITELWERRATNRVA